MNRLRATFEALKAEGRRGLMPFVTAGDPVPDALVHVLPALQRGGASVVEVGMPFTDPIADGPVIQASMQRALDRGHTVDATFEQVRSVREGLDLGLVAMVSYSIVHRLGLDVFLDRALAAGFDGFIFPDLAFDAAGDAIAASVKKRTGVSVATHAIDADDVAATTALVELTRLRP